MVSMRSFMKAALLAATAALVAACSDSNAIPADDPQMHVREGGEGYRLRRDVAIGPHNLVHWVQSLTRDFERLSMSGTDLEAGTIEEFPSCKTLNVDLAGKAVHHVHAEQVLRETTLYMIPHQFIEFQAKRLKNRYGRAGEFPSINSDTDGHRYDVADVFINGIHQPIHLVLSTRRPVIWNIQAAPNVTISDITILTTKAAAIVNAPEGANVRALSEYASHCGLVPGRQPAQHWKNVQRASRSKGAEHLVEEAYKTFYPFDAFFYRNFDQGSEEGTIGSHLGAYFLVGTRPEPDDRPDYMPVSGNTIKTSRAAYTFFGSERDYVKVLRDAVAKRAEAMMGRTIDIDRENIRVKTTPGAF
ncbi:MAG: hypothetical protein AAGE89_01595 [Pseudomonadota bacterium]